MNLISKEVGDFILKCYQIYGTSVVLARAIPNAIDGLKPVQKRLLYVFYRGNYNSDFVKSIAICADTQKYFHPHGEASVYVSLVKLAQPFNTRLPVIDTQGNWGSPDGDDPAAVRYTACRGGSLLNRLYTGDLDYPTVPFWINDSSVPEPVFLPVKIPMLLINGAYGLAVGYSTSALPHNPREVINYTKDFLLSDGEIDVSDYIYGPDFPTSGTVYINHEDYANTLRTGHGRVELRADYRVDQYDSYDEIHYTSMPYRVSKVGIIDQIVELYKEGNIPELIDIIDMSGRDKVDMCLKVTKGKSSRLVDILYMKTNLRVYHHYNMICLVDGKPRRCGFPEIVRVFLEERKKIVIKRLNALLEQHYTKLSDLVCTLLIVENHLQITNILKRSKQVEVDLLGQELKSSEKLSQVLRLLGRSPTFEEGDIKKILNFPLGKLVRLRVMDQYDTLRTLQDRISEIRQVLANRASLNKLIAEELLEVQNSLSDELKVRKTQIIKSSYQRTGFDILNTYAMTSNGLLMQVDLNKIPKSNRGVKGKDWFIDHLTWVGNLRSGPCCIVTDKGRMVRFELSPYSVNVNLHEECSLRNDEKPTLIKNQPANSDYLLLVSNMGRAKLMSHEIFSSSRSKIVFNRLREGEHIVSAISVPNTKAIVTIYTRTRGLRVSCEEFQLRSSSSTGIKAVSLGKGDRVVGCVLSQANDVAVAYTSGYVRLDNPMQYPLLHRGSKGVRASFAGFQIAGITKGLDLLTTSEDGKWTRSNLPKSVTSRRTSKGVKFQQVDTGKLRFACHLEG